MQIIVLGTRGFPDIQGGVETHCQNLYPKIVEKENINVEVIARSSYIDSENNYNEYKGVKLKELYAPRIKSLEAITHSIIGVIYAKMQNPDILHIHAIGPSLVVPFAKALGLNAVVTNHGPDYNREKWGNIAKKFLRLGEKLGSIFADRIIAISKNIKNNIERKYNRKNVELIFNGVELPKISNNKDYINSLGLKENNYIFACGRFVEEKGFHDLIKAVQDNNINKPLVIAGEADHETEYSRYLIDLAERNDVILTGFISGEDLNQLYSHAELFVLPSYHEGLPITLLEAMSYNLDVLVSDIPANSAVDLPSNCYFETGNIQDLSDKIKQKLYSSKVNSNFRKIVKEKYNWDKIAEKTINVYNEVLKD